MGNDMHKENIPFKTTLLRVAEIADQLWLNGVKVKNTDFDFHLQMLTLETENCNAILEEQRVQVEFGAFKALNLLGNSVNIQAMMVSAIAPEHIS